MKKNKKIVLTGGHAATTALATIEELIKNPLYELHWIGAVSAIEGQQVGGIEQKVLPQLNIPIHTIVLGRLQRKYTRHTLTSLLKIPRGFWQSYWLLRRIHPDMVLSFGGNVGLAVSVAAWTLGIPVIIHEQTVAAGLANRLSARFATKVALARSQSLPFFPTRKSIVVGNPIMKGIASLPHKTKKNKRPVIYITCGSRGSQIINKVVQDALPTLLKKYSIIHQTGEIDFQKYAKEQQKHYEVHATISPLDLASMYKRADIVVARAGANTVAEVLLLKRPALFIPIPWVQHNEQMKNAMIAREAGFALILEQHELSEKSLIEHLDSINKNWNEMIKNAAAADLPNDRFAAATLVALLEKNLKNPL